MLYHFLLAATDDFSEINLYSQNVNLYYQLCLLSKVMEMKQLM